jgi:DNA-binding transcriptional MocR family regulator
MDTSTTGSIVEALTRAIVEHRLQPGTKLAEQKLADHFGVSRTLVRQALFQLRKPPDPPGARARRLRRLAVGRRSAPGVSPCAACWN